MACARSWPPKIRPNRSRSLLARNRLSPRGSNRNARSRESSESRMALSSPVPLSGPVRSGRGVDSSAAITGGSCQMLASRISTTLESFSRSAHYIDVGLSLPKMSVSLPGETFGHPVPLARQNPHGVAAVPVGAGVGDGAHLVDKAGWGLNDLRVEPELCGRIYIGHPEPASEHISCKGITERLEVLRLSLVFACERGDLVERRRAAPSPLGEDGRSVAVLLDQLDLHGARLGDRDLDLGCTYLAAVVGPLLDHRQDVEGPDAEGSHPTGGRRENVVDDVTELEESKVAFGPRVLEQRVRRKRRCVGI